MEAILYAEIYFICMLIAGVLLIWVKTTGGNATPERWLKYMLIAFLCNFSANFLFTVFNRILIIEGASYILSYFFKTVYHISLCVGVFTWCGYANTEAGNMIYAKRKQRNPYYIPFAIPIAFCILNLKTHWLFVINKNGVYDRNWMFYVEMTYLIIVTLIHSIILVYANRHVQEPRHKLHVMVTASFPVCLFVALSLSFAGEGIPVIGVVIALEILCLTLGNSNIRISVDKLTMVNNRNNLIGYMNYKLKNNDGNLYLLMLDIDHFKSINDKYGHLIGDEALVLVAKILKNACVPFKKRPYIARFGGDEFIIIIEGTRNTVEYLKNRIYELVAKENEETEYELSVSIGVAKYEEGMTSNAFINSADKELYKIKYQKA